MSQSRGFPGPGRCDRPSRDESEIARGGGKAPRERWQPGSLRRSGAGVTSGAWRAMKRRWKPSSRRASSGTTRARAAPRERERDHEIAVARGGEGSVDASQAPFPGDDIERMRAYAAQLVSSCHRSRGPSLDQAHRVRASAFKRCGGDRQAFELALGWMAVVPRRQAILKAPAGLAAAPGNERDRPEVRGPRPDDGRSAASVIPAGLGVGGRPGGAVRPRLDANHPVSIRAPRPPPRRPRRRDPPGRQP